MYSDTNLTAKDATDSKTPAYSTFPRPESNGRRPGPGFDQKSATTSVDFDLLTRAILGVRLWSPLFHRRSSSCSAFFSFPRDVPGPGRASRGACSFESSALCDFQEPLGSTIGSKQHPVLSCGEHSRPSLCTHMVR